MGNEQLLATLAAALMPEMERQKAASYGVTFKHDLAGTPSLVQYSHGPNGLLTFPGVDPVVFNATMGAESIIGQIPATPSLYTHPTYFTLTGVTDESGDEPSSDCDDAPVAGLMKGCMTTSVFGRYERATPIIDIARLGQRVDRADPMDLRLVGSPIANSGIFAGPSGSNAGPSGDILSNEVSRKFWERNVAIHRLLARQAWVGNPTNNAGGYKEMTGLDVLINTGYVDAETGSACPAIDSYIVNAGNKRIDDNGDFYVARITDMYFQLKSRAYRAGVMPVRWMMAMRRQLFYELTAIWPCSYLSYRCNLDGTSANRNNIDAQDAVRLRDEMRAGRYLLIDGDRVDVVTDDGIAELDGNDGGGNFPRGCFSTSIYFIPMSVVGGNAVTYMEYFQYNNPAINDALGNMVLGRIEGAWITWPRQTNLCVQWQSRIEPRLVLRTPWLAGKIQNVVYCPIQHERDVFPADPYYVNGGKTTREGPSFVNLWDA